MRGGYDTSWIYRKVAALYGVEMKPNATGVDALALDDNPERLLLRMAHQNADNARSTLDYRMNYQPDKFAEEMYAALAELGYEMSDEERAFIDGTHELFAEAEKVRD
jgi:hypothetical protein